VFSIFICALFIAGGRQGVDKDKVDKVYVLRSTACLRRICSFYIDNTNIRTFSVLCNTKYQPKKGNFHKKITGFDQKSIQTRLLEEMAGKKKFADILQMA